MSASRVIEEARGATLVDEDGDPVTIEPAPALTRAEVERLEDEVGVPLPRELSELLARTAGIEGALEQVDFTGRELAFEAREVFPFGLPVAHDGFGNYWVLDLTPDRVDQAPVFFACHDAPVILYQSPSLEHFLRELVRMYVPPHASLVDDVHEDRIFHVWRTNPGALDHAVASTSADDTIRGFAASLDERWTVVDLRAPEIGMGFSWGRFGPRTEVRRHGHERLFAYARPPKRGLLGRLLG